MSDIFHGEWEPYVPSEIPENAPQNAMFVRRKGDGKDWYKHVHDPESFGEATVKIAVDWRENAQAWVVGPATRDATAIFPPNFRVYELTSYSGSDPQGELGGKAYDLETGSFKDAVYPPAPEPQFKHEQKIFDALDHILHRLEALEKS